MGYVWPMAVFANSRPRASPKIKETNSAEIISGAFAKEVFWQAGKVRDVKMDLRPEDFLCLILPEILMSPLFSQFSEIAEVTVPHFF